MSEYLPAVHRSGGDLGTGALYDLPWTGQDAHDDVRPSGGGLIDFFIWGVLQPGSHWYWVVITGPFFSVIYYFVFKTYLSRKNLSIDVSDEEEDDGMDAAQTMEEKQLLQATRIIEGLGGFDNIVGKVNNCLTRLRVDVKDMSLVDEAALKKTGAMGFVKPNESHIQVVYGPKVERIADNVRAVLKN